MEPQQKQQVGLIIICHDDGISSLKQQFENFKPSYKIYDELLVHLQTIATILNKSIQHLMIHVEEHMKIYYLLN
jgi:hypothetical protein